LNADLLTSYMDRLGSQRPFSGMRFSGMNAALAQSAGDGKTQTGARADHIDFDLYSGTLEPAAQGGPHGK
jgi:hypothetical protein